MRADIFRIIFCKKTWVTLLLLTVSVLCFSGCGQENVRTVSIPERENPFDLTPVKKKNGEPFTIGVMDLAPPIESSYLWLKGLAEGLQFEGYIPERVDLTKAPDDFYGYYDYLLAQDLGEYIAFDEKLYMLDDGEDEANAERIKSRSSSGELDVMAVTGTDPGLFLKGLDLDIPLLVSFATDPVASGIIDSAQDTGNENIWALVEPNPYGRQFEAYHTMFGFDKICMLQVPEWDIISGNSIYLNKAKALGVSVVELSLTEKEAEGNELDQVLLTLLKDTDLSDVDAVLFPYGTITDDAAPAVCGYLASLGIPSLVGDGDSISEFGGMMCLSDYDYEGYGNYVAMILSNIFHGEKAGDQPCVYTSSPHIVLNMSTVRKTGFLTNYELLRSVDKVYR